MYDLTALPAPSLPDLEPHFAAQRHLDRQLPELFGPFLLPVREAYPFASLFNAYGGIMRLIPPSTLGPLEYPRSRFHQSEDHPVPVFIEFPTDMPTRNTPWTLDAGHTMVDSRRRLSTGTTVILPLLGKGVIDAVVDATETTGTLVITPLRCPERQVYIRAPAAVLEWDKPSFSLLSPPPDTPWSHRLRRAISAQL